MPSTFAQSAELHIDQPTYEKIPHQSVIAKIFGYVDDTDKTARVLISISSPDGIVSNNKVSPTETGYFELFYYLDKYAESGTYEVSVSYRDEITGTSSFELVDDTEMLTENSSISQTSKIPSWVKNIFTWFGQDKISEDELIKAIEFLVNDGLIKLK